MPTIYGTATIGAVATITAVIDVNDTANSVSADAAIGTAVGITARATRTGFTISYSLTDSASGQFQINASTGVVTTATLLDFDSPSNHVITVLATCSGGTTSSQSFTIAVAAVASAPVNTVAPVISGTGVVTATMTRTEGTWTGYPTPTLTGQWYRNAVEIISGQTASTYVVATADLGPTRPTFLGYDLYDGGECPTPAVAQTNEYYVDPTNGSNSNDGLSTSAPWQTVDGRTLTDAVVWVIQPASGNTHDMTGVIVGADSWWQNNTASNVTVRPVGEDAIYIANNVSVDGNGDGSLVYCTTGNTDVTFYKLGADGWGQGFYLEYGSVNIRILHCMAKNPQLESDASSANCHHVYMGYHSGVNRVTGVEVAYCTFQNTRTPRMGAVLQNYGSSTGVREFAFHHNVVLGGNYTWLMIQAEDSTEAAEFFANTAFGDYSDYMIVFSALDTGTGVDADFKVHGNILSNSNANRRMVQVAGTHAPTLSANNTVYSSGGTVFWSGTTLAAVGQERNPGLDSTGLASNLLERGTGALRTAAPSWTGLNGKLPSSLTNMDRGAYQYGIADGLQGKLVYTETGSNASGAVTEDSNAIAVTA